MSYALVRKSFGALDPTGFTAGGTATESEEMPTKESSSTWGSEKAQPQASAPAETSSGSSWSWPDWLTPSSEPSKPSTSSAYPSSSAAPAGVAKPSSNAGIAVAGLVVLGVVGYLWLS